MKKIAILTSGGDVPGLNACIRAVVRAAIYNGIEAAGVQQGFDGLIHGRFAALKAADVSNILHLGGTILRSSRSEAFRTAEGRRQAHRQLKRRKVDGLVVIGGDGSLRGASVFAREHGFPVAGIPKTIDNDISGTDWAIGHDTALNTAMGAIDRIRDTAESHHRVFVVEVMGRDAGYIAYGAGLASGAEAILIPETKADLVRLGRTFRRGWGRTKSSLIVIVAEGDEKGGARRTADFLRSLLPGAYVGVTVLGHVQRGGSPTASDRILAARLGVAAVDFLAAGKKNIMAGMVNNGIVATPLGRAKKRRMLIGREALKLLEVLSA